VVSGRKNFSCFVRRNFYRFFPSGQQDRPEGLDFLSACPLAHRFFGGSSAAPFGGFTRRAFWRASGMSSFSARKKNIKELLAFYQTMCTISNQLSIKNNTKLDYSKKINL
jgi:hypothetical protein